MYHPLPLHNDPVTSLRGTRTRIMTNRCHITSEYAISCVYNILKCPVDELGHIDDSMLTVSSLNCIEDNVGGSRKLLNSLYPFSLPAHLTYHLQNLQYTLLTIATTLHYPWRCIPHSRHLFRVANIPYPALNDWLPLITWTVLWCLLGAGIGCRRCEYNPDADFTSPCLGRDCQYWSQRMGSRKLGELAE